MHEANILNSTHTWEGDQTKVYSKYPTFGSSESNQDEAKEITNNKISNQPPRS